MDNRTHAQRRRAERQEALRDFLQGKDYIGQIDADLTREIPADELATVKFKTETRLKLLAKILPDLSESRTDLAVTGDLGTLLDSLPVVARPDRPLAH